MLTVATMAEFGAGRLGTKVHMEYGEWSHRGYLCSMCSVHCGVSWLSETETREIETADLHGITGKIESCDTVEVRTRHFSSFGSMLYLSAKINP